MAMNRSEQIKAVFTRYNEELARACDAFAANISSEEGPTEIEMEEHFEGFSSFVAAKTEAFWDISIDAAGGDTARHFIETLSFDEMFEAFCIAAQVIDDDSLPKVLENAVVAYGEPMFDRLLAFVMDAPWKKTEGQAEEDFYMAFLPAGAAIRLLGKVEYEKAVEPVLRKFCSFPQTEEFVADSVKVMMVCAGQYSAPLLISMLENEADEDVSGPYEDLMIMLTHVGRRARTDAIYAALRATFRRMKNKVIAAICIGDYGDVRGIPLLKGYLDRNIKTIDRELFYESLSSIRRLGGDIKDIQDPFKDFTANK
ncbi:MAG TPA: hypothetical protein PKV44_02510 [Bacillota bacterium]|nr:hypothetical protein [Bacillota bacterium]